MTTTKSYDFLNPLTNFAWLIASGVKRSWSLRIEWMMKLKFVLVLLLLAGCGPSDHPASGKPPFAASHPDGSTSNKSQISMPVQVAVTNMTYQLSELSEEGQIRVIACEYVVRETAGSDIVVFHSLKKREAHVLAFRLPKHRFQSVTHAVREEETGDLRDKVTRDWGMELEIGPVEMIGRDEAFIGVIWGYSVVFHVELEKGDEWRIRKVERSAIDGPRRN